MTIQIVVSCDGTAAERPGITLQRCRAFITVPPAYAGDMADTLNAAGWQVREPSGAHLCPACSRAVQRRLSGREQPCP